MSLDNPRLSCNQGSIERANSGNRWFGSLALSLNRLKLMQKKPPSVELVLTGRYADKRLIDKADLVTEMTEIKHPYLQGIQARKGIEY